jgi:hypothetical protein
VFYFRVEKRRKDTDGGAGLPAKDPVIVVAWKVVEKEGPRSSGFLLLLGITTVQSL